MPITDNDIIKNFFLGFIRLHVLYHASKGPVYGFWMIKELGRHGYNLSPGTLYPILHRMERDGFIFSEKELIKGKWRRYYRITDEGRQALSQSYYKIKELINELNE
ncbi:MAG TPA: PadR family transcriptional regulator [Dehalococcoidales bacterium]|nr:MAG: PadR family transcriptional regulator [Chloroflexi bacterium RBG_16_60_22]HJX13024.1 PadR family transcriptional regulator [Dehalococcoidales bacterium]